ncbi:MAG: FkbM family methyltransferase [Verrucomicrobiota bacterium]|jgi:FkbM family methyltransferase
MIRSLFKKTVLTSQVHCHWLGALKSHLYRRTRKWLRMPHEPEFASIPCFQPQRDSLFLDIGANLGQSIDSIRLYASESPIISFEPNPYLADRLRGLQTRDQQISIEECGLGSVDGQVKFYIPVYNGYAFHELASVSPLHQRDWLKPRIWGFDDARLTMIESVWRIRRLDDLRISPLFIKVDVEGAELDVIRGGLNTIERCQPAILLEGVSFDGELKNLLRPMGYQMYRFQRGVFSRADGRLDSAFLISEPRRNEMKRSIFRG